MFFFTTLLKATAAVELFAKAPGHINAAVIEASGGRGNGFHKPGFFSLEQSDDSDSSELLGLTASSSEVTYASDCAIGMGFDFVNQKCMAQAVSPVKDCEDDASDTCLIEKATGHITQYTQTVSSSTSLDQLISDTASVSGSGWGVSISASATYVSHHSSTTQQVSFYIGQTGQVAETYIQNPVELKLTDAAKLMLTTNPTEFINIYGTQYIYKITDAATFIGSVDIVQTSAADSTQLSVMASISATELFAGSFEASNSFESSTKEGSSYLQITAKAEYSGQQQDFTADGTSAPANMQAAYSNWCTQQEDDPFSNAVPTTMVYRPWTDLADVQEIIANDPHIGDLLSVTVPTAFTMSLLQKETILSAADQSAAANLLGWDCVTHNADIKAQVEQVYEEISAHLNEIQSLGSGDIIALQDQITAANFDWFTAISGDKVDELNALLASQTCSETFSTGDIFIQADQTVKVAFPESAASAFMDSLMFTTRGTDVAAISATGTDIGFRHVTETLESDNPSGTISWDNTPQMEVACPFNTFITSVTVTWAGNACSCYSPNTGTIDQNMFQCTDGGYAWCTSSDYCSNDGTGETATCHRARRRTPARATGRLSDTQERKQGSGSKRIGSSRDSTLLGSGSAKARMDIVELECSPLPAGRYGLPTAMHMAADQILLNEEGKTLTASCPEGYMLTEIDVTAVNQWMFTLVDYFTLKCRSITDFQV